TAYSFASVASSANRSSISCEERPIELSDIRFPTFYVVFPFGRTSPQSLYGARPPDIFFKFAYCCLGIRCAKSIVVLERAAQLCAVTLHMVQHFMVESWPVRLHQCSHFVPVCRHFRPVHAQPPHSGIAVEI